MSVFCSRVFDIRIGLSFVIGALLVLFGIIQYSTLNKNLDALYDYEHLKPFLFSFGLDESLYQKVMLGDYLDPLGVSVTAVSYLYYGETENDPVLMQKGLDLVGMLREYPYTRSRHGATIYLYDQPHDKWAARSWWSGMSNASIALAFSMAFDQTQDEGFRKLAYEAAMGVTNGVQNNGSAITLDAKSKWFEEFVADNTAIDNATFALNGFTMALIAIKTMSEYFEDEVLLAEYYAGLEGFESRAHEFHDPKNWLYYSLNPKDIESMHYAIFDLLLIKTLYYIEPDSKFLHVEISKREELFRKNFGIRLSKEAGAYFSWIGVPYPYWIDVYPGKIIVKYKSGNVTSFPMGSLKHLFCCDLNEIDRIDVYQSKNNVEFSLFSLSPDEISSDGEKLQNEVSIYDDLVMAGGRKTDRFIYETTSSVELRLSMFIEKPFILDDNKFSLINYTYNGVVKGIQILLIDINGVVAASYYPAKKDGDEFGTIAFSPIGFKEYYLLDKIKEIRLYFSIDSGSEIRFLKLNDFLFNLTSYDLSTLVHADSLSRAEIINVPFK